MQNGDFEMLVHSG